MNIKQLICKTLVFGALGATSGLASAGNAFTTFAVTSNVASSCTITALPVSFGSYVPTSATDTTATGSVSVTCTKNASVSIALNAGTGTSATETGRTMSLASNTAMTYGLFADSGYATNWGTTAGAQTTTGTGLATPVTLTVYGKITKNQYLVGVGNYSDTITATVTY